MSKNLGPTELRDQWPSAYEATDALPGFVCDIWVDDGTLMCCYGPDDEQEAYWDLALKAWCDSDTCEPIQEEE